MEEAHSAYPGNVTSFNSFDNCTRQGPQIVLRLQTSGCCNSFQHSSKRPEFQFLPRQQTSWISSRSCCTVTSRLTTHSSSTHVWWN